MTHALALAAGVIYCLGFAPFDFWPATFAAIAAVYVLLQQNRGRPGLLVWWFGVGKYGLGASWVYVSINVYGGAPPVLAGTLVVLFVMLLAALFSLPAGWLFGKLRDAEQPWTWTTVGLFASVWVLVDWLSTWLFTGFPWLLPGYGFMQTPMAGVVPVFGVLGAGWLVVLSAAAIAAMIGGRLFRPGLAIMAIAPWLMGAVLLLVDWVRPVTSHSVALVQGNLDQSVKWDADQAVINVRQHLRLSEDHWDVDLLVWPEAAITLYPHQAEAVLEDLARRGQASGTSIVLGIPGLAVDEAGAYQVTNMALGLGEARGRFAKQHLVPFGEYVPMEGLLRGLIGFFDLPMSSMSAGSPDQPNIQLGFGEAAMAICYEVAYPASMRDAARSAAVLMTLSNDTWFGSSIGPLQHMQIAQMRALENGRWMLRATNNGVTAIVDHRGEMRASLPQFEAGVLRGDVTVMTGRTPLQPLGSLAAAAASGRRVADSFA